MTRIFLSFFDRFPDFDQNPSSSVQDEFNRLAKMMGWTKQETKHMRARCYEEEFDGYFAVLELNTQLQRLQHLCIELDVMPLSSVTQCKKALRKVNVNLVDLIDSRRMDTKVRQFHSYKALIDYTLARRKIYPKDKAKGDVIKILLKQIFRG